jgi:carbon-monoxide dehydrogenase large subunit
MAAACIVSSCAVPPLADSRVPGPEVKRMAVRRVSAVIVTERGDLRNWVNEGFSEHRSPGDADGGSAAPISPDGYFLTADHVISGMAERNVFVLHGSGGRLVPSQARVVWRSKPGDLALLKISAKTPDYYRWSPPGKWLPVGTTVIHGGIATGLKGSGRGPFESAIVRVGRSGKVSIFTGAMAMGQGLKTVLAQIAADQVGVRPEDIAVVSGDTATIQLGLGGFASRQTVTAGNSVHLAARAVREKAIAAAAIILDVPQESLDIRDGLVIATGRNLSISLRDIANTLAGAPGYKIPSGLAPGLESAVNFETSSLTYGIGAHAVELEVDPLTGGVRLVNYVVVNDCGRIINPMTAEGQIHGGAVHGIGNALFEWMKYDASGQPLTTSFQDYLLPSAPEVPRCLIEHVETPNPLNPLGVKGAGEGGTIPAPAAIISAIEDALSPFGVRFSDMPLTPSAIVEALRRAGAASAA